MTAPRRPRPWRPVDLGRLFACVLGVVLATTLACTARAGTAGETTALVDRAVAHILLVGQEQAFTDITRRTGDFVDGELYVFCIAFDGRILAHGGNPKLVGKLMLAVRDAEGTLPVVGVIRVAQTQGQGWFAYLWPNLTTGRVQRKTSYVVRIDNQALCGSGYYDPEPP
jgi:cytochrome c